MLAKVTLEDGQVSGVDDLSPACSSLLNWEVDDAGINAPRPGLGTISSSITEAVNGAHRWTTYIVLIDDNRNLWSIPDGSTTATKRSTSTTTTQLEGTSRPVFASGFSYMYVAGGAGLLKWGPGLSAPEQVTNAPDCTHVATLGQRLITNDLTSASTVQAIRWSGIGEGNWGTWSSSNTTDVDALPDGVRAVYDTLHELFVWGDESLQVYGVGTDPSLPFDRAAAIAIGLSAYYSPVRDGESFYFLSDQREIVFSDGRSVNRDIGRPIGKTIRDLSTVSDCFGWIETSQRSRKLVYRFPTEQRTFVLDLSSGRWGERNYYRSPTVADWSVSAYAYRPTDSRHFLGSGFSAGGILTLDSTSRQDLGNPILCERVTGWHDHGSRKMKRSMRVQVGLRRGTATETATPGWLEARVQNDDQAWSEWEQISVGNPGEFDHVQFLYFGGVFTRRRYHFRHASTESFSLAEVFDDVEELDT